MKYILLDSIRSMQNVGAIFRNSDGSGFDKVLLTGYTPTPPRNDISKTAIGAENYIDWEYFDDGVEVVNKLKKEGFVIISVELIKDSIDYKQLFEMKHQKVCLILGNEIKGVKEELINLSDYCVEIPMRGKKASLNVSVAAGIVMYAV